MAKRGPQTGKRVVGPYLHCGVNAEQITEGPEEVVEEVGILGGMHNLNAVPHLLCQLQPHCHGWGGEGAMGGVG